MIALFLGVLRYTSISQKSLGLSVLITLTFSVNSVFLSSGATTSTSTITGSSSGVRPVPLGGEKSHVPQFVGISISQLSSEVGAPQILAVKLP